MSVVCYEVAHALNQRAGRLGIPTRVFCPANEGVRTTDGTRGGRSPSEGGGRRRRAGKTFHHSGVSARGLGRTCYFGSDQKSSCHTFPVGEDILARYSLFPLQTPPRQTSGTAMRGRHLGPAALIGPDGRSGWCVRFGGRAYLCH